MDMVFPECAGTQRLSIRQPCPHADRAELHKQTTLSSSTEHEFNLRYSAVLPCKLLGYTTAVRAKLGQASNLSTSSREIRDMEHRRHGGHHLRCVVSSVTVVIVLAPRHWVLASASSRILHKRRHFRTITASELVPFTAGFSCCPFAASSLSSPSPGTSPMR